MLFRSAGSLDIFAAEDPLKKGKLRLYSANTLELATENYGVLRSANSIIEVKAPQNIKLITEILYTPTEGEISPRFSRDATPYNAEHPLAYVLRVPSETESFIKNNKKQWIPTNSNK